MIEKLSRRNFLKMGAFALPGLAYPNLFNPSKLKLDWTEDEMLGRVTIESVSVHSMPSDTSRIIYQRYRDELVNLYNQEVSPHGPEFNPIWYKVWRGYVHSARIQLVKTRLNPVVSEIPETGRFGEITVPVTYPLYHKTNGGKVSWIPLYPLYYESVHCITGVIEGPDKMPWYEITEAWSRDKYYVPGEHVRLIPEEEMSPLSPDVPAHKKRIEISIARQTLIAYEDDKEVLNTKVSTGLNKEVPGMIPWKTPTGEHRVTSKMPSQRMGDDPITSDVSAYVLPGVPWVCYIHETGVAIHGTYWHNNYGMQMSHGCINMRPAEALWVYRWTTPAPDPQKRETRGMGTLVSVH